ncbi:MAG: hypothetical protein AB7E52_03275, partial [Bdellovibrionales bacterium]
EIVDDKTDSNQHRYLTVNIPQQAPLNTAGKDVTAEIAAEGAWIYYLKGTATSEREQWEMNQTLVALREHLIQPAFREAKKKALGRLIGNQNPGILTTLTEKEWLSFVALTLSDHPGFQICAAELQGDAKKPHAFLQLHHAAAQKIKLDLTISDTGLCSTSFTGLTAPKRHQKNASPITSAKALYEPILQEANACAQTLQEIDENCKQQLPFMLALHHLRQSDRVMVLRHQVQETTCCQKLKVDVRSRPRIKDVPAGTHFEACISVTTGGFVGLGIRHSHNATSEFFWPLQKKMETYLHGKCSPLRSPMMLPPVDVHLIGTHP